MVFTMTIKYICDVNKWFDRINGNTYHSVNITDADTNKLIYSSGLTYGYGEQYKQTAKDGLIKLGLYKEENRFNHEFNKNLFYWSVNENALKRDLKKIEVE